MNRRDQLAVYALNGLIACGNAIDTDDAAKRAYAYADAMIAASPPDERAIMDVAYQIGHRIMQDLRGRPGFREAWDGCDRETQNMIQKAWAERAKLEILRYLVQEMT